MTDDKNKHPLGSRKNPVMSKGASSQAGLHAIINRIGGPRPVPSGKEDETKK